MSGLLPTLPLIFPVIRGLILITILLLIGLAAVERLLRKSVIVSQASLDPRIAFWLTQLPALLASFLLALSLARSLAQYLSFTTPGDPFDPEFAQAVVTQGSWGRANLLETISVAFFLVFATLLRRRPGMVQRILLLILPILAWTEGSMGHGVEQIWEPHLGQVMHALHLLGSGIWLGTLTVLSLTVFPFIWHDDHSVLLSRLVRFFSVYARCGAILVVFTGVNQSLHYVPSFGALMASTWGKLLIVKLSLFIGVLALGAWNWRRVTPALEMEQTGGAKRLRWAVRFELLLGFGMLVVTAMLVGTQLPGK